MFFIWAIQHKVKVEFVICVDSSKKEKGQNRVKKGKTKAKDKSFAVAYQGTVLNGLYANIKKIVNNPPRPTKE